MKDDFANQIYEDILVEERADPFVTFGEDGFYYFTASYPVRGNADREKKNGYDRIILRKAKTISDLRDAKEVEVWNQKNSKKAFRYVWAPELHKVGEFWYLFFTASIEEDNVWGIRPHVLKCMGDDLMDEKNWTLADESNLHRMEAAKEDTFSFQQFSLDMTYFSAGNRHYVVWADKPGAVSSLYIAEINPEEPWKLITPARMLSQPEYDWEDGNGITVNEGPAVLKHDNMINLCFSAAAVDYTYCVGILRAREDGDLLDIRSWKKEEKPLLTSGDFVTQCGPGHNSFTKDADGNDIFVYHARPFNCSNATDAKGNYGRCQYVEPGENPLSDPCRHARAKMVRYDANGMPVLNKTSGYLFVTFTGDRDDSEQVYFALSKDGLHWKDLHGKNPVLRSNIGEKGVRDPFLLRTLENKFVIVATDLRIANGKGWEAAVQEGSRSVIFWESEDLIHWSDAWSVELAVEDAGCAWAPEMIYDPKKQAYMIFFASHVSDGNNQNGKHRIYRCYTKDFHTFTQPEVYIERENDVIDTTMIEDNGRFYRFSKDETTKNIRMDTADEINGRFHEIKAPVLNAIEGVEGPAIFRLKDRSFCLLVDQYATNGGYLPLRCEDLKTGDFHPFLPEEYDMGQLKKRHGSVLALTEAEYERVEKNYAN